MSFLWSLLTPWSPPPPPADTLTFETNLMLEEYDSLLRLDYDRALSLLWARFMELSEHVQESVRLNRLISVYLFLLTLAAYIALLVLAVNLICKCVKRAKRRKKPAFTVHMKPTKTQAASVYNADGSDRQLKKASNSTLNTSGSRRYKETIVTSNNHGVTAGTATTATASNSIQTAPVQPTAAGSNSSKTANSTTGSSKCQLAGLQYVNPSAAAGVQPQQPTKLKHQYPSAFTTSIEQTTPVVSA